MELVSVEFTILSINSILKKKFLITGIRHEIRELKLELQGMKSFLRVANKCNINDHNELFDFWASQLQDMHIKLRMLLTSSQIYVRFFTAIKFYRIKAEIKEIALRNKRYDLGHIEEAQMHQVRAYSFGAIAPSKWDGMFVHSFGNIALSKVINVALPNGKNGSQVILTTRKEDVAMYPFGVGGGRLIRLWVAEGFVEERKGSTLEEVGKSNLKELISRSLLQVKKSNTFLGSKKCRLHDLMRVLALSISDKVNFSSIYDVQAGIEDERIPRRLSLFHPLDDNTTSFPPNMAHVRSFAAFNICQNSTLSWDSLLSSFKLLRVLELNESPIDHVPTTIGKLFNLRYLNLSRTGIKDLPESMWRLKNLQTLDIRETCIEELPSGIHRIELTNVRETDGIELCASIGKMKLLRHLLVMATNENEFLALDALPQSSAPTVLRKLTLVGRLKRVPSWFPSLRNIIYLHLHWSQVAEEDPIQYKNGLPNLEHLALVNAYDRGKVKLCFYEGFPNLQDLFLVIFHDLGEIIIANGVMPSLVRMKLHVCGELKKVPRGIEHLTKLGELDLKDVSDELIDSIRGEQSVDYAKVKHIPAINHSYKIDGRYEYESLSRA
ncbi:hypothetical protein LguiA_017792 [Lonicera macranthoides]